MDKFKLDMVAKAMYETMRHSPLFARDSPRYQRGWEELVSSARSEYRAVAHSALVALEQATSELIHHESEGPQS